MKFSEFIKKHKPLQFKQLNSFQLKIVSIIDELESKENIQFLFKGRKACPYRIVQHLWVSYMSMFPNKYKSQTTLKEVS